MDWTRRHLLACLPRRTLKSKRFLLFMVFPIAILCLVSHQYELDPILGLSEAAEGAHPGTMWRAFLL
ncbi:hypothetical protein B0H19DRAFT_597471 [Mycena capillaripes]|nr:hypothetical protein B0H19DRAFT_597471 [Mycena capillaripes]